MQLIGTLAVVVSVLVLAYQGRELAVHSRVANEVAGTKAHREVMVHWKSILDVFIRHPELHAHYYGQATVAPSESEVVRLTVIAEQQADWLEAAMISTDQLRSYAPIEGIVGTWNDYVAGALASSPILRSWIRANPGMNPPLDPLLASYDAAQGGSPDHPIAPSAPAADTPPTPDLGQQ